MSFSNFLAEAEEGIEYKVNIRVGGSSNSTPDDLFMQCHEKCEWLNTEGDKHNCRLFQENLELTKGEIRHPLRTKECLSATDALI